MRRRLSEQLDGITHGPQGSMDKLLMTWVEQSVGHAALATVGTSDPELFGAYMYSRAQSVMGGTSQIQKNIISSRILGLGSEMYDMPDEIDVKADGGLRIITLNRPDELNAVNDPLHVGLAKIWEALNEDVDARAAVITGAGRAFRLAVTSTTSTSCATMKRYARRRSSTAATSSSAWCGAASR